MKLIEFIVITKKETRESNFDSEFKSQRIYNPCKKKKKSPQLEKVELQSRRNYIYFHAQFCLTLTAAVIAWALEYS